MYIVELMDKGDQVKYELLQTLKSLGGVGNLKSIQEHLEVAPATLTKYIEKINQEANEEGVFIELDIYEDDIHLKLDSNLDWSEVIYFFLSRSVKFQIIDYLFANGEYQVNILTNKLAISQSTLHRNITALNECLGEFDIQIKNGKFAGPEHQIRYFLYELYRNIAGPLLFSSFSLPLVVEESTLQIKQIVNRTMTGAQSQNLRVWVYVCYQRRNIKQTNWLELEELIQPFLHASGYQRIEDEISDLSIYNNNLDAEFMNMISFLMSMSLVSYRYNEKFLALSGPILATTTLGMRCIKEEVDDNSDNDQETIYLLSQSLSRLYFYQGYIKVDSDSHKTAPIFMSWDIIEEGLEIGRDFYQEILVDKFEKDYHNPNDLVDKCSIDFAYQFYYLKFKEPSKIKVGIKLEKETLSSQAAFYYLKDQLGFSQRIEVEEYRYGEDYDYLVIDYWQDTQAIPCYLIKSTITPYDVEHIKSELQDLLS